MTAEHDLLKMLKGWKIEQRVRGTSLTFWELRKPNSRGGEDLVAKIYYKPLVELLRTVCQRRTW